MAEGSVKMPLPMVRLATKQKTLKLLSRCPSKAAKSNRFALWSTGLSKAPFVWSWRTHLPSTIEVGRLESLL
jgi:hypothetical protein